MPKIYAHCSYIGTTGYNNHSRDFFRELSKYTDLKVRNFTIGKSWVGHSEEPHNDEPYFNETDRKILYEQNLHNGEGGRNNFKMYQSNEKEFFHDFNIVLNETNHFFYYDQYNGPKIAYNVWESTLQPQHFFDKLQEYDELWVPSKWQKECTIKQGYDESKIQVVPEGVDSKTFFPEKVDLLDIYKDGRFKFFLIGRWDYRKSTKEIIEAFLKTFDKDEPVDLVVNIDNPWGEKMDGFKTTEERLEFYGLNDERVKIIHFMDREDYIKCIKTGHVFVSCARAEGWNLPLIESMASGTPSIYSNCSAQLEFAEGKGLPINIIGESSALENTYGRFSLTEVPGNYYVPDYNHLSQVMRDVYENYETHKEKAIKESEEIRNNFDWVVIGKIGYEKSLDFYNKINSKEYKNNIPDNKVEITYLNGPKVEIKGPKLEKYFIEILDENDKVIHSSTITNNMWTKCGREYYTKWKIKINGELVEEFDLEGKTVLLSFESKSVGDTLAWAPYSIELMKKRKCNVILSTFHNEWFEGSEDYKDIKFIKPGQSVVCDVIYKIGWFRDDKGGWRKFNMYPNQVNLIPLQKTITDIIGLDFYEMNHKLNFTPKQKPIKKKYIVFGPQATSGCKEWVFEHWVELSKKIKELGYEVVILSTKHYNIDGVINITNKPWDIAMNYLFHAEFFIGLGSGLSWMNWALGKKTVMINGFVEDGHEFTHNLIKVTNNLCIKCWNDPVHVFDSGDWDWCPVYKGTERQHICQKSISVQMVFDKLKDLIN